MKQMVQQWLQQQAERVDRLSQRERVFLFTSVLVVLVALADTFWLTPAMDAQRKLVQRFGAQTQEINQLRGELQAAGLPANASGGARDEIARINQQLDALQAQMAQLTPQAAGAASSDLERVLVQFLRRQERLTLLGTSTLREEPVLASAAAAPADTAPANALGAAVADPVAAVQAGTQWRRQGMELRVAGPYNELVRYVRTLEAALPGLRWGTMALRADGRVPELQLQVFVVEARP